MVNVCSLCKKAEMKEVEDQVEEIGTRKTVVTDTICDNCAQRYPDSLVKAHFDHFRYALKLITGETLFFTDADILGDYATLTLDKSPGSDDGFELNAPRGVDVRIDQIVWCIDTGNG